MAAILVAGALLLAGYLAWTFWQWHRLSHIPGPSIAGFSKIWMVREGLKARQPMSIKKVTDKYGELSSLAQRKLTTLNLYGYYLRDPIVIIEQVRWRASDQMNLLRTIQRFSGG